MLIRNAPVGLFVLRNRFAKKAYEDEKILLEEFAKFTAISLRYLHIIRSSKQRRDFRNTFIREREYYEDDSLLYDACCEIIKSNFGVVDFVVISTDRESDKLEIKYKTVDKIELNDKLNNDIRKYKNEMNAIVDYNFNLYASELQSKFYSDISDAPLTSDKRFSIFSIRAESGRVVNIILIGSDHVLSKHITAFLKELFSIIGFKQSLDRKKYRLLALAKFATEITKLELPTLSEVFKLAYDHTSDIMSVSNMYLSLLQNNDVTFPIFYKKEDGSVIPLKIPPRKMQRENKNNQPRTEWILINKEPILIKSRKESIEWYESHGGNEKIGDPFASWLGVPIFNKGETIGVIVVFHPTSDYLYTDSDRLILENIASHLSSLITQIELAETNCELKKAEAEIIEKENLLSSSLIAQDITHRLNNSLGSLSININQAREDINYALASKTMDHLSATRDSLLNDAAEVVDNLIGEVRLVSNPEIQKISIQEVVRKITEQVLVEKKLKELVKVYYDFPKTETNVKVPYRNLANCLHVLIENAAKALFEESQKPVLYDDLYLRLVIHELNGMAVIDVIDNGTPIPEDIKHEIFERGISSKKQEGSGYGLWRAKTLANSLKGSIDILKAPDNIKNFRLSIPVFNEISRPLAFIIDDERAWQNIISRWLKEVGFDVKLASDIGSARTLIGDSENTPALILLDISLDRIDSANVDGLTLISMARRKYYNAKIILLTGFKARSINYQSAVDLIIEKVSEGKALTKAIFLEKVFELNLLKTNIG